jgi:DNA-binding Xre family transcriptional regulator
MESVFHVPTRFRLQDIIDETDPPISQTELARQAGVSFATVNRLCTNATAQVSLATLDAISRVLGCEPGDLIERAKGGRR